MPGQMFLHLWCQCGHVGRVAHPDAWLQMTAAELLPRFRCQHCRRRPVEMRRIYEAPGQPGCWRSPR